MPDPLLGGQVLVVLNLVVQVKKHEELVRIHLKLASFTSIGIIDVSASRSPAQIEVSSSSTVSSTSSRDDRDGSAMTDFILDTVQGGEHQANVVVGGAAESFRFIAQCLDGLGASHALRIRHDVWGRLSIGGSAC